MLTKHRFQPRSLRRQCGLRYERDNDALVNVVYEKAIPTTVSEKLGKCNEMGSCNDAVTVLAARRRRK
ncbi:hypothetical protein PS1_029686 [Malus domestica]